MQIFIKYSAGEYFILCILDITGNIRQNFDSDMY